MAMPNNVEQGSRYACDCGEEYTSEEFLKRHQVCYEQSFYMVLSSFCLYSKIIAKIDHFFHVRFVKKIFHHQQLYVNIYFYVETKQTNVQNAVGLYDVHILLTIMKIIVLRLMK